ncbi:MAG: hydroxymethylbilane synthase [Chloroflexi bacterium]|nr:hydroxymethylbilane synthase [Chloroflexota bacterium]
MKTRLTIGSRGSKLALIQTEMIIAALKKANPRLEINLSKIKTTGDRERNKPFDDMEGSGIFVKEIETALLDGRIDLAVHSLKDMMTDVPRGLCLAAVTERADPRDVLVSAGGKKLAELPPGARIGTGSPRRAVQLTALRPNVQVQSIRGNVDSRLRRVSSGELDGVIVAAAGIIRLGLQDRITEYLPIDSFLPAVGQGALALEARADDKETLALVAPLNHMPTWQSVTAERAFLRAMGGGCTTPIAALGTVKGDTLRLSGMVSDVDGTRILKDVEEGKPDEAEQIGIRLARKFLDAVSAAFIAGVKKSG